LAISKAYAKASFVTKMPTRFRLNGRRYPISENLVFSKDSRTPRSSENEIWMLTVYAKNEAASIPGHILKKIKEQIDGSL
jgi:hypothetical protein